MILQALYDYAQRKGDELPEDGFEDVEIKYLIKIREDGSLVDLVSTEETNGNGKRCWHKFNKVPQVKHTNAVKSFLLLDNFGYVLLNDAKKTAFIEELSKAEKELPSNIGLKAVLKFYNANKNNGFDKLFSSEFFKENDVGKLSSTLITFQLITQNELIVQNSDIIDYYRKSLQVETSDDDETSVETGICLVTGEKDVIARTHIKLSGICDKQSPLISFNKDSFLSYGKKQSYNAPVSMKANYGYSKALNYLLDTKDTYFKMGKDKIVFWAEKKEAEAFESSFSAFFATNFDDADRNVREVKNLFAAVQTGKYEELGADSNFYVLCLSPNAARISVRFWETGKVETFAKLIKQHFEDFEIVKPSFDEKEYLNLYQILSATALERKMENVAPNLIGSVMQSILKGLPYPTTLQQQCIRRIRAEKDFKDNTGKWHYKVNRERAAILKAYINRLNRQKNIKEVSVALDRNCTNKGYLLGRLFAAFEKVQKESADTELNSTITDRFYGAASTNPVTVFTQLMRLNRNHMSKLQTKNRGCYINRDKEIGEIMNAIDSFPAHLDLNEQSYFAIGYYHEKQSFFDKPNKSDESKGEN